MNKPIRGKRRETNAIDDVCDLKFGIDLFETESIITVDNYSQWLNKVFNSKSEDLIQITGEVTDIKKTPNGNVITIDDKMIIKNCEFTLKIGKSYEFYANKNDVLNLKECE
jgi:RecJ-like exonuclease